MNSNSLVRSVLKDRVILRNDAVIDFSRIKAKIRSFIELEDKILFLVWTAVNAKKEEPGYDLYRNIFCYSKNTGERLWQVEQPWQWRRVDPEGREMRKVYVEEVYKLMWLSMYEGNRKLSAEKMRQRGWNYEAIGEGEVKISAFYYFRPFRPKVNRIEARTLSHFPKDYTIDIDTGKVDLLEVHQPSEKIY